MTKYQVLAEQALQEHRSFRNSDVENIKATIRVLAEFRKWLDAPVNALLVRDISNSSSNSQPMPLEKAPTLHLKYDTLGYGHFVVQLLFMENSFVSGLIEMEFAIKMHGNTVHMLLDKDFSFDANDQRAKTELFEYIFSSIYGDKQPVNGKEDVGWFHKVVS